MPTYEHICDSCLYEWEDTYSIKADPPKTCPKCGAESARRLISLGGKGVVELYGQDLVDKIKGEARQLKKDMHKSETVYANLLGNDKYEAIQKRMDASKKDRKNY
jgi:putative FmdB family regulatory protein